MGYASQVGLGTLRVDVAEFDASLADLKSNLGVWIGNALAAQDVSAGLRRLCQELELAIVRGRISLPLLLLGHAVEHHRPAAGVAESHATGLKSMLICNN